MDMPVNVPVDDPNADTEWNDILRKHGVIPEKPKDPEPIIQEAILEAQKRAHENRLEGKDLDELHELEDEEDEEFLAVYRQQRFAELAALQKSSVHGQVYPIQKVDYGKDVTEASSKTFVLVNLIASSDDNVESRILIELWRQLAVKFGDLKFCQIRGNMCIEGYPERNCPTILIYKDGDIKRQIVTLKELNGPRTSVDDLEQVLVQVGALKENDTRLRNADSDDEIPSSRLHSKKEASDDDDDWD